MIAGYDELTITLNWFSLHISPLAGTTKREHVIAIKKLHEYVLSPDFKVL